MRRAAVIQPRTVRPLRGCDRPNRARDIDSQEALFGAGSCLTGEASAIGYVPDGRGAGSVAAGAGGACAKVDAMVAPGAVRGAVIRRIRSPSSVSGGIACPSR